MQKTTIHIKGLHCAACKTLIEDVASEIDGVHSTNVNPKTGETVVEYDENFDLGVLKKEIEALGDYQVNINN
jgi:Cu+-exporting ATPase